MLQIGAGPVNIVLHDRQGLEGLGVLRDPAFCHLSAVLETPRSRQHTVFAIDDLDPVLAAPVLDHVVEGIELMPKYDKLRPDTFQFGDDVLVEQVRELLMHRKREFCLVTLPKAGAIVHDPGAVRIALVDLVRANPGEHLGRQHELGQRQVNCDRGERVQAGPVNGVTGRREPLQHDFGVCQAHRIGAVIAPQYSHGQLSVSGASDGIAVRRISRC